MSSSNIYIDVIVTCPTVVLFALALDDQWPLVHLLDLHYLLARIWVVGSIRESELDLLLLLEGVRHCRSYVRHYRSTDLQQGSAPLSIRYVSGTLFINSLRNLHFSDFVFL